MLENPRYDADSDDDEYEGAQALFTRALVLSRRTGRVAMAVHILPCCCLVSYDVAT